MSEKRLLLVAHCFPPAGGGGVQRPAKLAKFLPRHGWRVTVLTTQPGLYREMTGLHDPSLLDELPPEVEILRVDAGVPSAAPPPRIGWAPLDKLLARAWNFPKGPDFAWAWNRMAYPAAVERARQTPFDAVLVTAPRFSSLPLGRQLALRLGRPLVIDLRDPWCPRDWPPDYRAGPRARRWERQALKAAAHTVVVTEGMRQLYAGAYPQWTERFSVIENGVDLEEPWRREPAAVSRERFEVVYTGQFYTASRPDVFFRGLALARERSAPFREKARLIVAGGLGLLAAEHLPPLRNLAADFGVAEAVEEKGYLPHADAVRLQRSAGALLLVVQSPLAPAGKSYEYLAAGRPVLALVPPDGEARRVLAGAGPLAVFADPDDPADVAGKLLDLFARWERGELFNLPAPEVPREYTRAWQAGQMAGVLDRAVAETRS